MWYGSTKTLLESSIRWLESDTPQGESEWQAQADLVQTCLAEMAEMAEPTVNPSKVAGSRYVHRPVADKLNRAMPHVRSMLTATRDRNRNTAMAQRLPFNDSEARGGSAAILGLFPILKDQIERDFISLV